jgi:hypothetical protein
MFDLHAQPMMPFFGINRTMLNICILKQFLLMITNFSWSFGVLEYSVFCLNLYWDNYARMNKCVLVNQKLYLGQLCAIDVTFWFNKNLCFYLPLLPILPSIISFEFQLCLGGSLFFSLKIWNSNFSTLTISGNSIAE